jgi:hypothetical protein
MSTQRGNDDGPQVARAEQLMTETEERATRLMRKATRWLAWSAARAREEAEDIWHDAQQARRGE